CSISKTDPQPPANEWLDIMGNGLLMKKVLQPGGGRDSWPDLGQTVKINLKTRLLDGTLVEELSEFWFTLGHREVIPALDAAVQLMGMGEKAVIMTDGRYANGFRGNLYPEIPSKADLSLEVKLLEATDAPDLKLLSPTEKIALATCKKEQGNVLYRCRAYDYAVLKYSTAMEITESISKDDIRSEEENKLMEMKVKCLNNMAASMLKLEDYDAALTCSSEALIDVTIHSTPDTIRFTILGSRYDSLTIYFIKWDCKMTEKYSFIFLGKHYTIFYCQKNPLIKYSKQCNLTKNKS
uniref:peptidylprolyl isomerase n=1 Tax=Gouania willdenowi TaxID=441366 RepID=A0A8C5DHJ8_GOUWI